MITARNLVLVFLCASLAACGSGNSASSNSQAASTASTSVTTSSTTTTAATSDTVATPTPTDVALRTLIDNAGLTGKPDAGRNLPDIGSDMAILGKLLFFSKNLSGDGDVACASCHDPALGGGDGLSLSVGVDAVNAGNVPDPELLGPGRHPEVAGHFPLVARNAPSVFNSGFSDTGLFVDSRVESIGREPLANGTASAIATPDSATFNAPDPNLHAGTTLPSAQARFPVTVNDEMRGDFATDADHQSLRGLLAERFNDAAGNWAKLFQQSFGDPTITFDRIADAIGEYERSMDFTESPWNAYVGGDLGALSEQQKQGAILFLTPVNQGGAGCSRCHSGDTFSDGRQHLVAFPQVSDDRGRENVDGNTAHRYQFRTPSLLNVAVTAPYGHAGLYGSLTEVVDHYVNPRGSLDNLFGGPRNQPFTRATVPVCQLPQFSRILAITGNSCETLMTDAYDNSELALNFLESGQGTNALGPTPRLDATQVSEVVAFLRSLTDPCVQDRVCLGKWIVDSSNVATYPDNSALIAHDESGSPL